MCWYMTTSPAWPELKKLVPSARSNRTMNCEPAMNGVAITTSSEVVKLAQTRSGMRQNVMPGARIVMIVTRKFSAVATDDAPANWTATLKKSWPRGASVESGAYAVQPVANEPPGTRNEAIIMIPAIGSSQYDRALRRGNAMSGAPIISGSTKFASPANTGITNRKMSSEAWTENRPLKVSESTNCIPGRASSARISMASTPPTSRKKNEVTVYWIPITLWSVLMRK